MSTTISAVSKVDTDQERLVLDALDFAPPCDVKKSGKACPEAATWVMELRAHCLLARAGTRLIGEQCHQYVIDGGTAPCNACGSTAVVIRQYVVHLEPIKP